MAASTEQETFISFISLASDPILHIFSYLDYRDLVSCCHVCQRLRELASDESHWKYQCKKYWLQSSCTKGLTWKSYFAKWYEDFGKYIDVYREIKNAWNQIEKYTSSYCIPIYDSLKDGLSESELNNLERQLHLELPADLRCSYRIHNGQTHEAAGLYGSMMIHTHFRSEYLISLNKAVDSYQEDGECGGCLQLTYCPLSHISQLVAISEDGGYLRGQVFYPTPDHSQPGCGRIDNFITANSFLEWLTTFAQQLHSDIYPKIRGQIFRFTHDTSSIATTEDITVKVSNCFMPELSTIHPPHFFHTYHIEMSMGSKTLASRSCQLEMRHWIITDEEDNEDRVDGPGVVGEYPVMKPGSHFSWTSCTTFPTTYGNMKGHFRMRNLSTGATVNVQCPTFHMKCLPYQTSTERKNRALIRKKNK